MEQDPTHTELILGGIAAAVAAGVGAWRKWGPKPVEEKPKEPAEVKHDCTRKEDINGIKAQLAEGSITFERLRTENEQIKFELREQAEIIRQIHAIVHRTLGRLDP